MAIQLSYEQLANHRDSACELRYLASESSSEPAIPALLAEVSERLSHKQYESFSLQFHARDSAAPRQGIYAVTLPGLPTQHWFLVPLSRDDERTVYEACFNRVADAQSSG